MEVGAAPRPRGPLLELGGFALLLGGLGRVMIGELRVAVGLFAPGVGLAAGLDRARGLRVGLAAVAVGLGGEPSLACAPVLHGGAGMRAATKTLRTIAAATIAMIKIVDMGLLVAAALAA